eukprot:scaffold1220_cov259-Pinguiococcus_pyrenoidosus.AAC.96
MTRRRHSQGFGVFSMRPEGKSAERRRADLFQWPGCRREPQQPAQFDGLEVRVRVYRPPGRLSRPVLQIRAPRRDVRVQSGLRSGPKGGVRTQQVRAGGRQQRVARAAVLRAAATLRQTLQHLSTPQREGLRGDERHSDANAASNSATDPPRAGFRPSHWLWSRRWRSEKPGGLARGDVRTLAFLAPKALRRFGKRCEDLANGARRCTRCVVASPARSSSNSGLRSRGSATTSTSR